MVLINWEQTQGRLSDSMGDCDVQALNHSLVYVLIPAHRNLHWCLLSVILRGLLLSLLQTSLYNKKIMLFFVLKHMH